MSRFTRVTVVGSARRGDIVLPSDEELAVLLPQILDLVAEPPGQGAVTLVRHTGDQLDVSRDLDALGLPDGEILRVVHTQDAPPPAEIADVTEAATDVLAALPGQWDERARRATGAVGVGLIAGAAGVVPAYAAGPDSAAAGLLGIIILVLLVLSASAPRAPQPPRARRLAPAGGRLSGGGPRPGPRPRGRRAPARGGPRRPRPGPGGAPARRDRRVRRRLLCAVGRRRLPPQPGDARRCGNRHRPGPPGLDPGRVRPRVRPGRGRRRRGRRGPPGGAARCRAEHVGRAPPGRCHARGRDPRPAGGGPFARGGLPCPDLDDRRRGDRARLRRGSPALHPDGLVVAARHRGAPRRGPPGASAAAHRPGRVPVGRGGEPRPSSARSPLWVGTPRSPPSSSVPWPCS